MPLKHGAGSPSSANISQESQVTSSRGARSPVPSYQARRTLARPTRGQHPRVKGRHCLRPCPVQSRCSQTLGRPRPSASAEIGRFGSRTRCSRAESITLTAKDPDRLSAVPLPPNCRMRSRPFFHPVARRWRPGVYSLCRCASHPHPVNTTAFPLSGVVLEHH